MWTVWGNMKLGSGYLWSIMKSISDFQEVAYKVFTVDRVQDIVLHVKQK